MQKNPTGTVLYLLEQAIKEYRKLSQKHVSEVVKDITVDQCLVLMILDKEKHISQHEVAKLIFKDYASITRMIELMVKKGFLKRTPNAEDRRKFNLTITAKGTNTLTLIEPVAQRNRETALGGLTKHDIDSLGKLLNKIITNCKLT